jgi:hypothetical protein
VESCGGNRGTVLKCVIHEPGPVYGAVVVNVPKTGCSKFCDSEKLESIPYNWEA